MTPHGQPSWNSTLLRVIAAIIIFNLFLGVLPRVLPSLIVLAIIVVILRLVWFFTSRY